MSFKDWMNTKNKQKGVHKVAETSEDEIDMSGRHGEKVKKLSGLELFS